MKHRPDAPPVGSRGAQDERARREQRYPTNVVNIGVSRADDPPTARTSPSSTATPITASVSVGAPGVLRSSRVLLRTASARTAAATKRRKVRLLARNPKEPLEGAIARLVAQQEAHSKVLEEQPAVEVLRVLPAPLATSSPSPDSRSTR
jgi:hypothetical protein